jgi:XTP/dITP diphosphohydrolase
MTKLLLATQNKGKIKELQDLLLGLGAELIIPEDLDLDLDIEECGITYLDNATKKAAAYSQKSNLISLADDSGLEVEALAGAPGIFSARFSPKPGANDQDRRHYLLKQLQGHARPWTARFRCTVVLAAPGGETQFADGLCPGEIIPEERGDRGFGYDPIFLVDKIGKTMAELSITEKNQLSHRALAVRSLWPDMEARLRTFQNL